ncbi:MAG: hypothetical protein AB1798_15160 [Spirochaetota bacterium]
MIPITRQPEPKNFDRLVRKPGKKFLRNTPNPTNKDWKNNRYWQAVTVELYNAYKGICSYSGEWISRPGSVDHFIPKRRNPYLAYEWDNYRLSSPKLNNYKGDKEGITDPFAIDFGWFVLEFPSCLIKPGLGLSTDEKRMVQYTIDVLKLNDGDDLVQNRCNILVYYAHGDISFKFLSERYKFIAAELQRQGLVETAKDMFGPRKNTRGGP